MELSVARAFTSPPSTAPSPARTCAFWGPCYSRSLSLASLPHKFSRSACSRGWRPLAHIAVIKATGDSAFDSSAAVTELTGLYRKVLLPIIDRNPYLSEATRQAAATTTSLAKKYGAEITVLVIDENTKDTIADHDLRIKNIRWHLSQGGFEEFGLLESLGEGKLPAAIIGEIADDLSLDLVVLSMESIHTKHIDGNLLAEFVPCPIMLLPL